MKWQKIVSNLNSKVKEYILVSISNAKECKPLLTTLENSKKCEEDRLSNKNRQFINKNKIDYSS